MISFFSAGGFDEGAFAAWIALAAAALASGFFSSYLGFGGGIVIVSLAPVLTNLSPAESARAALFLILCLSLSNAALFARKRLIDWNWALSMTAAGSLAAFFSGRAAPSLSDFSLRLILWFFLFFVTALPSAKIFWRGAFPFRPAAKPRLNKTGSSWRRGVFKTLQKSACGALMGLSSGLSGFSGGVILSPLLHETRALPLKNISPSLSFAAAGLAVFALFGHQTAGGPFSDSLRAAFPVLLIFSFSGLIAGHFFHRKKDRSRRLVILRLVTAGLFLTVSFELIKIWRPAGT